LFYVEFYFGKHLKKFLVDTGSALTIVPLALADKVEPTHLKLTAANGTRITCYGTTALNLVVRKLRRDFPWNCVVADVTTPILGADFLAHYNLGVDMAKLRLIDLKTALFSCGIEREDTDSYHRIHATTANCPQSVDQMLMNFPSITQPFSTTQPVTHATRHHIKTSGPPVGCKPRQIHGAKLEAARAEFTKLQELGIVRTSKSPWSSPIHLVPKGTGWRVCGDYRRLNALTEKDSYPMSNAQALTCLLHGKTVFSKIDLVRGYNQIPMDEDSIAKTCVVTPFGSFEYLFMPFGLCNASQTFQRFMNELLGHLPFVFVYIDDILIF